MDRDNLNLLLKSQIEELRKELEEKQNQVILSAQFGKQLLESNNELNQQLEEIQEANLTQIEELCQENYSLKMKIEGNSHAREYLEMDNLKLKLQEEAKQQVSCITANHNQKVIKLGQEIEALQAEIERGGLVTEQLQEKLSKQDEMLAEAHQYSKQLQEMGVLETTVEELKEECILMKFKNDELNISLNDAQDQNKQLLFDQQNLVEKIECLKENMEQKNQQGNTWFEALQESRQKVSELQMEVSVLKAEVQNRSHKEKGNSLFGEIEDRRVALQQKFTTINTKYESLQKTHQIIKKQLHQYKSQILPMLQMAGNQADSSKIRRLEAALSQSQNENQRLYVKIKDLEKGNKDQESGASRLERLHDVVSEFEGKKDYVTILHNEITRLAETITDLKSKGEMTTLKLLAETTKRRETESLLHISEVKKEKSELDVVRLRLKMEEMKIKLQEGKSAAQVCEPLGKQKNQLSIWQDSGIFTKKEKTQGRPSIVRSTPEILTEVSVTKDNNTSCSTDANVADNIPRKGDKSNQPTEILSTKVSAKTFPAQEAKQLADSVETFTISKVKPIGRVTPLNERSPDEENRKTSSAQHLKTGTQDQQQMDHVSEISLPGKPDSCVIAAQDHATESKENKKGNQDEAKVGKIPVQKLKMREPQNERIIHVKKPQGSKNECQQQ